MAETVVRSHDRGLGALGQKIAEMGGIAEKMLIDAMGALIQSDGELAQAVIERDNRIGALQREIEDMAILTIANHQPIAMDLREIVGAIRIAGDLERVGDRAKNIARRSIKIGGEQRSLYEFVGLKHMNEVATVLLKDALNSYAQRDIVCARDVWERDVELDALENSVFRDLLTHMMEDPCNITYCAHLLFCSKNVERIGDHATNIAKTVFYLVTGNNMPVDGSKTWDEMVLLQGGWY